MASRQFDEPIKGMLMNTRTRTIVMAAALAAAAAALGTRAADQGVSLATDAATRPESVQLPVERKASERGQRNANAAPLPLRTADDIWWTRERAEDDGYVWPLPPAPSRRMATITPTPKVDDAR
jgi:hypothetical protein